MKIETNSTSSIHIGAWGDRQATLLYIYLYVFFSGSLSLNIKIVEKLLKCPEAHVLNLRIILCSNIYLS